MTFARARSKVEGDEGGETMPGCHGAAPMKCSTDDGLVKASHDPRPCIGVERPDEYGCITRGFETEAGE